MSSTPTSVSGSQGNWIPSNWRTKVSGQETEELPGLAARDSEDTE